VNAAATGVAARVLRTSYSTVVPQESRFSVFGRRIDKAFRGTIYAPNIAQLDAVEVELMEIQMKPETQDVLVSGSGLTAANAHSSVDFPKPITVAGPAHTKIELTGFVGDPRPRQPSKRPAGWVHFAGSLKFQPTAAESALHTLLLGAKIVSPKADDLGVHSFECNLAPPQGMFLWRDPDIDEAPTTLAHRAGDLVLRVLVARPKVLNRRIVVVPVSRGTASDRGMHPIVTYRLPASESRS
jgi:hypothetical protein